ncbi:hypothetical protein E3T61_08045 [Cryobacterium lactosi]|jgi:hypothetical protein|uniref:Cell division protein FtsL n=1 Tax=Cryobacterium lactosi TaxID=1259202 RepID=A0A4V3IXN2_9MICO|nr:hypothetical protein [Cryobacterium lactosi]TFD91655.1 hypothetical protein E3T61_08045 [Cryobacterium lactosi]
MSDNLARVLTADARPQFTERPGADERRHIEIVSPSTHKRPRVVYALSAVACVGAIVIAQLLLSVGISQGAYEISALRASQVELGRTADSVSEDLIRVSSPQSLAANAEALGMVSNSTPAYLRLSDGAVLGAPTSASGSQAGAASLVPNSLLTGVPLVTQVPAGGQGASVASGAPAAGTAPVAVTVADGLPSPTTR